MHSVTEKKLHKVYCTVTLWPWVMESRGFHQNVQKLFDNTRKGKACMMQLNILCLVPGKWTTQKKIITDNTVDAVHDRNSFQQAQD